MWNKSWDVVIVGAGPAGAATAAWAARAGLSVLLLDRSEFPRQKPCGECISPAAVVALARLGALDSVLQQPHAELRGWRVSPMIGSVFEGRFPADERGVAMSRARLDSVLVRIARDAGATVWTGARVTNLMREREAVTGVIARTAEGERRVCSKMVVGADGLRSVVVRRLRQIRRAPRLRKVALTAHVRGSSIAGDVGELRLRSFGCVGIADVGGGLANVVVVLEGAAAKGVAGSAQERFDAVLREEAALRGARRVCPVMATGPFDWPTTGIVADGALLVGDAAGYYDPFTGQGIYRALRGAELASQALIEALDDGDVSQGRLRGYEQAHHREFSAGERVQHVIEAVVSRPRLMRIVARPLERWPHLADALVAVTGDLRPVKSLLRPHLPARVIE